MQFTTIFINFFNLQDEVKGERGLAALALGKFEGVYEIEEAHEIEGSRQLEVGSLVGGMFHA